MYFQGQSVKITYYYDVQQIKQPPELCFLPQLAYTEFRGSSKTQIQAVLPLIAHSYGNMNWNCVMMHKASGL